jgi:hypothetical protein
MKVDDHPVVRFFKVLTAVGFVLPVPGVALAVGMLASDEPTVALIFLGASAWCLGGALFTRHRLMHHPEKFTENWGRSRR